MCALSIALCIACIFLCVKDRERMCMCVKDRDRENMYVCEVYFVCMLVSPVEPMAEQPNSRRGKLQSINSLQFMKFFIRWRLAYIYISLLFTIFANERAGAHEFEPFAWD